MGGPVQVDRRNLGPLFARRQANGDWWVDGLDGKRVAVIRVDGRLEFEPGFDPDGNRLPTGDGTCRVSLQSPTPSCDTTSAQQMNGSLLWALIATASHAATRSRRRRESLQIDRAAVYRRTATLRGEVARAYHLDVYCDVLGRVQRDLVRAWGNAKSLARKKRALFELWDRAPSRFPAPPPGLSEPNFAEVQTLRNEAIERARGRVVAFIAERLPPDGPNAYTAADLKRFEAKRTAAIPFDPYGTR